MKSPISRLGISSVCLFIASAASAHAGSAIASDGHGGYGFSYGAGDLRHHEHVALADCRQHSSHPDSIRILGSTEERGAGAVVRYFNDDGSEHVAFALGRAEPRFARERAFEEAHKRGAVRSEVIREWVD